MKSADGKMKEKCFQQVKLAEDFRAIITLWRKDGDNAVWFPEPQGVSITEPGHWLELYSSEELMGSCSQIYRDEKGEHIYVDAEFSDDENGEYRKIVIRLPEKEIVEARDIDIEENFRPEFLQTPTVSRVVQRIAKAEKIIFALAHKAEAPVYPTDEMNELLDKIDGKIYRSMPLKCPHCNGDLVGSQVKYTVVVPVSFFMHAGTFGICEAEAYQSVTEAVNAGKVVGECLHCGRELSAEYINRHKGGWQYRWRYDPHK